MDSGLLVLNSNVGLTNVIEGKKLNKLMISTFKDIKKKLSDHCGPYGNFAILTDPTDPTNTAVHTKDGINIVRNMYYASPIQEFIRRTIMYLGTKAENLAGDGTTASMIFAVSALEYILKKKSLDKYTFNELKDLFEDFLEALAWLYTDEIVTLNEYSRFSKKGDSADIDDIAFSQAYTSSHGNEKVSRIVAECFSKMPKETWGFISCERSRLETTKDISLEWDDSQCSFPALALKNSMMNCSQNSAYVSSECDLLILPFEPTERQFIYSYFNKFLDDYDNEKDLVIIVPTATSCQLQTKLDAFSEKNNKVAIFKYFISHQELPELECLTLLSGFEKKDMYSKLLIKRGVDVSYRDKTIRFKNLYPGTDDIINPLSKVGDIAETLKDITQCIELEQMDNANVGNSKKVISLKKYYLKLFLQKRCKIIIGGAAHDNSALVDPVQDTIIAVYNTLTNGFVFSQNYSLRRALTRVKTTNPEFKVFAKAFLYSIDEYRKCLFKFSPNDSFKKKFNRPFTIFNFLEKESKNNIVVNEWKKRGTSKIIEQFSKTNEPLIIQPSNIDLAILKRFAEISLKFIKSSRVLVPNSVVK